MELLTLIGLFICPVFTLGAILCHYGHGFLGAIAIIYSIIRYFKNN